MRFNPGPVVLLVLVASTGGCVSSHAPESALDPDELATVRIALTHWQESGTERFEIRGCTNEGPWSGAQPSHWLADEFGLYRCEILERESQRPIFVQGFCSVFGEWLTTEDSKANPTLRFEESIRVPSFPFPITVRLSKRNRENVFVPVFQAPLDLGSTHQRSPDRIDVTTIGAAGDPRSCLDIAFLAEGYSDPERGKFLGDAARLGESLFQHQPFASMRSSVNLHAVFVASAVSGVSKPDRGIERTSALGCRYSTFGLPRYVLTLEDDRVRTVAAAAPYDAIVILLNDSEYGGGGIFEQYCVVAADSNLASYLFVHEFGHSLTGLGDEYYTSPVAYQEFVAKNVEPWEPNITALKDPTNLKWRAFATPETALPTPWGKTGYESLNQEVESKRKELRSSGLEGAELNSQLGKWRTTRLDELLAPKDVVGAFEGALYSPTGLYRPEVDCIMFRREASRFCRVCESTVRSRILRFRQTPTDSQ